MSHRPYDRGHGIVGPFILIVLGIVLLLQQFDVIHWSLWEIAFRLWPLIIIAVGADILIARRSFLGALVSLAALLGLMAGGLYLMGAGRLAAGETIHSEQVAYPLDDAESGRIELSLDAGKIEIGGLDETSRNILEGTLRDAAEYGTSSARKTGSQLTVEIRRDWPHRFLFFDNVDFLWDLDFSARIPLDVDISLGAGQIEADLTGLDVASVDVSIGAGQVALALPAETNIDISVKIGAGDAQIRLPDGAAVDIECVTAVGNCNLPGSSGLWSQSYVSSGFDEAEYKIRIHIDVAVGEGRVYYR
ncbi:MAG: LiaI-LiaF-like domain-containing protein [Anaerolineales bacterium]